MMGASVSKAIFGRELRNGEVLAVVVEALSITCRLQRPPRCPGAQ